MDEPVFSESDLQKADEIFEATARHLLDKNAQMLSKYRYLLLMESMVSLNIKSEYLKIIFLTCLIMSTSSVIRLVSTVTASEHCRRLQIVANFSHEIYLATATLPPKPMFYCFPPLSVSQFPSNNHMYIGVKVSV